MLEFRSGDVFVNHRIEGLAGRGGMGVVYRARDLDLDRIVALKVIAPALAEEPDFRARFVAESKAAASIEHPHVIPVYYAGEREGVLFIVMRYVDGPDLRALVRAEGSLDPERAASIVAQVGGALDAAHAHGLVHRDVKPANVLLGAEDHAYLTDFGLTKREASTGGLSRAGGWVGTLGFVAPEQIRGERVDARTDVYALGCVLVHALTGGAPFIRESDEATLWAHLNAPPPTDRVPPEFAGVVERALSKDPADRFPSAGDLGRAASAAAGRSAAPGPERNVARGAAAPEGTPPTAATARVPPHEGETHVSPPDEHGATAVTTARHGRSIGGLARRPLVAAGAAGFVVAGAIAAIALGGGGDDVAGSPTATTATTLARSLPSKIGPRRQVAVEPNSITITKGRVWVMSTKNGSIVVLDAKTGEPLNTIITRSGGTAVAAGFGSIWALKDKTSNLLRYKRSTRRRIGAPIAISVAGRPVIVATGEKALWVGVRKEPESRRDGTGESLVRIDPSTSPPGQQAIAMPGGVGDVAVGEGAVWVTNTFSGSVTRVDPNNLKNTRRIRVGPVPNGVAVGEGAVWVALGRGKAVARVSPRTRKRTATIPLGVAPTRVAVGGGSVWVTARDANRLFRIDPRKRRVRESLETDSEPFALDVTAGHYVYVTLTDDITGGGVQRVRFYP
ncbi:MAG TPA: serine/threonine-protein kinase [Solirubrobacteraceae bacterium]|jgi:YVTN family beta-propeller protein|nr:serine/threonine-protein kinase [Solirubrobacteraceae bacterium]